MSRTPSPSTTVAEVGDLTRFDNPRQLAAYLGLIPSKKRLENLPKPIQDIGWKAQVRLCKRYRRLTARG